MTATYQLGLIGGGVMGEALLSRLLQQQVYTPDQVIVSELLPARRDYLKGEYQVAVTDANAAAIASDTVLLAIKPQVLKAVTEALPATTYAHKPLLLSILAGVPLARLAAGFPDCPVIRAMPNTPAIVGAGTTAIAPGQQVTAEQLEQAKTIFGAVGTVVEVAESLMDAVTGVSGSGPAFVALMVESLSDGGVAAGLPRPIANNLAQQTVLGTAQLLVDSGLHPGQLKDRVTSPGGTTIAGVATLEQHGFRAAVIEAVQAAATRSQELGG
ncbi:MAG: pyrroline-5-carboxylate reductase [Spirulina sp. SIO3F2]|nr:pyrroline-5-carboxylate reductase [Spirulina sp. SIO3F2]